MIDFSKDLEIAQKAARGGAKVVLGNFGKSKGSHVKGNAKGLVTATDLAAEKAILDILSAESDYAILSEESGSLQKNSGPVWVVDPLDGTNNFARTIPLFAVSVGLMEGNESLVGVIIDVVNNKEYYAVKGGGAFCNGERIIHPKFDTEYIPMLFLNHGYPEVDRAKFKELSRLLASDFNTLKLGTTALELCYIASGSVDGFICSGDELWDFAAGIVITQEAGCIFTDWHGKPWDGTHSHLVIARPEIHNVLVKKISWLQ
ncbi:MAG: myo-inositol-1 [Prolixibacteraceae bacterium]|nr:MAG: myo-inositol-1 [Prolixibacteraceae bacterium]